MEEEKKTIFSVDFVVIIYKSYFSIYKSQLINIDDIPWLMLAITNGNKRPLIPSKQCHTAHRNDHEFNQQQKIVNHKGNSNDQKTI